MPYNLADKVLALSVVVDKKRRDCGKCVWDEYGAKGLVATECWRVDLGAVNFVRVFLALLLPLMRVDGVARKAATRDFKLAVHQNTIMAIKVQFRCML